MFVFYLIRFLPDICSNLEKLALKLNLTCCDCSHTAVMANSKIHQKQKLFPCGLALYSCTAIKVLKSLRSPFLKPRGLFIT